MNPSENEIRDTLRHREPPAGFAERVMSQAGRVTAPTRSAVAARTRLAAPVIVIAMAIVLVAAAGLLITNCASACSIGGIAARVAGRPAYITPAAGGGHALGPVQGEITLEEWGDYQCPACGVYFPFIEEMLHRYPNQIRFEFHHFPLTGIHRNAMGAAVAAEAAGEQNHFWEMHRALFMRQKEWASSADPEKQFVAYAAEIGIDVDRFRESLQSEAVKQRVLADAARAQEAKFSGTPTFLINGKKVEPATADELMALVLAQLAPRDK